MSLRGAIWAAVSSKEQAENDKDSIPLQLRMGHEAATRHSVVVVAELIVPGQSRDYVQLYDIKQEVEAYAQLEHLLDTKAIDVLFYLDASRLGRTLPLIATVQALADDARVFLFELKNPPGRIEYRPRSHQDLLLSAITAVGAEQELVELQRRHHFGMIGRVKAGKVPSGQAVWGYRMVGDAMVPDPEVAPWVPRIFAWYAEGDSGETIITRLNEAGVTRTGGGAWRADKIYSLLDRVWRYAGYGEINRKSSSREYVRERGNWPPLIDDDLLHRVLAERQVRTHNRKLADDPYTLSHVVWCEVCGIPMTVHRAVRKHRPSQSVQMQLVCHQEPKHPRGTASYPYIMAGLAATLESLATLDLGDLEDSDPAPAIQAQQEQVRANLVRLAKAVARADEEWALGNMDDDRYRPLIASLRARIDAAKRQAQQLEQQLEHERSRGSRRQRAAEVIARGQDVLAAGGKDANVWLRNHLRVWVRDNRISWVELL